MAQRVFHTLSDLILRRRLPGQVVIQLTTRCNARCPQCGMRIDNREMIRTSLPTDAVKRTIDAAAAQGVQALSFTGGEPLLELDRLIELLEYAGSAGIPYIRTGTNGFFCRGAERPAGRDRVRHIADRLAATPLRNFWISIDSADPATHDSQRGFPGLMDGMAAALEEFHRAGIYPTANLGINRHVGGHTPITATGALTAGDDPGGHRVQAFYNDFRLAFSSFYRRVIDLGFTMVNACYPMSVPETADTAAVYAATSCEDLVRFTRTEKALIYQAMLDTIPVYREKIRIFTPRSALHALIRQYREGVFGYPCRGGRDFFFIDAADGNTYPCGYRGTEKLGPLHRLDRRALTRQPDCRRCDWECFRDPSELAGPLLQGAAIPAHLLSLARRDPAFLRLWLGDLLYYRACRLFDGRQAPDYPRLGTFSRRTFPWPRRFGLPDTVRG
ncbi:MAG: radical SAM protein [Deltaproteobacteria bacterium]|nr:radical SAM protein [Candidatus Anaeroferrophillacea bacterium]